MKRKVIYYQLAWDWQITCWCFNWMFQSPMTIGAFSRNISATSADLKLVTDNLPLHSFLTSDHTTWSEDLGTRLDSFSDNFLFCFALSGNRPPIELFSQFLLEKVSFCNQNIGKVFSDLRLVTDNLLLHSLMSDHTSLIFRQFILHCLGTDWRFTTYRAL